jgi:hypothetical protein
MQILGQNWVQLNTVAMPGTQSVQATATHTLRLQIAVILTSVRFFVATQN